MLGIRTSRRSKIDDGRTGMGSTIQHRYRTKGDSENVYQKLRVFEWQYILTRAFLQLRSFLRFDKFTIPRKIEGQAGDLKASLPQPRANVHPYLETASKLI